MNTNTLTGLTIDRKSLVDGMNRASKIVNGRSKTGLYKAIKIESKEGKVTLSTASEEAFANVYLESENNHSSSVLVEFKSLNQFLKKSKADRIEIVREYEKAIVVADNIRYSLEDLGSDHFPTIKGEEYKVMHLPKEEYVRAINNTSYAISKSDVRPTLKGINLETMNGHMYFVATDSHRLGRFKVESELEGVNVTPDGEMLKKSLVMMNRKTESVEIGISESYTKVKFDNVELFVNNNESKYPQTDRLIPTEWQTDIKLDVKEAITSLEQLKIVDDIAHMEHSKDETVIISMSTDRKQSMKASLDTVSSGEDVNISFSIQYMTETLKTLLKDDTEVDVGIISSMRPFILKSNDGKAEHIVLPVRST